MHASTLIASCISIACASIASVSMAATTCAARSAATVPVVVELYTSEGCDSCPPADRWLASLDPIAGNPRVLPLAFHIDYWDYLGWKDPYADPAFGARHRMRAGEAGAKVVYTPQVLVDNREFQQWRRTTPAQLTARSAKASRAELRASVAVDGDTLKIDLNGVAKAGVRDASALIALYESGLASEVRAGENRGATLRHDFVVRRLFGPFRFEGQALAVSQAVVMPPGVALGRSGIAVIAQDDKGTPIQALSVALRDCSG